MKYSDANAPYVCMQTNSTCYKGTGKMAIVGVLWHSTGANNPNLKRYVQPSEGSANYNKDLAKLGVNTNKNDWNHITRQAGLNCWIGKFADGSVGTVQTMPWDYKPWGCGAGSKGSCNNGWIQFEICEDALTDEKYFNLVYAEACELTAYLCKKFNLNPNGTVTRSGVAIPVLTCHNDAAKLGFGNLHADINHWFPRFGKSMATVRQDVTRIIAGSSATPAVQKTDKLYRVQIGAFAVKQNAFNQLNTLRGIGQDGIVVLIKNLYKVQVGAFAVKQNAEALAEKLKSAGYSTFITTEQGQMVTP